MTIKGGHHTEEAKKKISEAKRQLSGRSKEPLVPQLSACGCGEYAAVDERRNRVAKYVSGHNSRSAHPMKGKHHTSDQGQARVVHRREGICLQAWMGADAHLCFVERDDLPVLHAVQQVVSRLRRPGHRRVRTVAYVVRELPRRRRRAARTGLPDRPSRPRRRLLVRALHDASARDGSATADG